MATKKIVAFMFFIVFFLTCCTDYDAAKETLKKQGYTKIKLEGHSFWGCSKDDHSSTAFRAYNPRVKTWVKGAVCCGMIFKGCYIRYQ